MPEIRLMLYLGSQPEPLDITLNQTKVQRRSRC
uniref:Uncharacterized protein n=1 Tax=Rhizophora mucronata TaxID=61149 RepID=A0A2P2NSL7_RHIMU